MLSLVAFDVQTLTDVEEENDLCAVALAHNYIDIWHWRSRKRLALIKSTENSVMYVSFQITNSNKERKRMILF
jgi:hypothetical protein